MIRIVNKFGASLTDDVRVVIYDRHMFIVEATDDNDDETFFTMGFAFSMSLSKSANALEISESVIFAFCSIDFWIPPMPDRI
jgi:hypothetical protein